MMKKSALSVQPAKSVFSRFPKIAKELLMKTEITN